MESPQQTADDRIVITKANALIEASYTLSLHEQRMILACAAQLDGRKPIPKGNMFTLTVEEYAELFGLEQSSLYTYMEEAANKLYERDIRQVKGRTKKRTRWVYLAEYCKGEGKVKLGFSPEIAPYITLLHRRFTSYKLSEISGLTSTHSIRIFEMLMQYQSTGVFNISVEELRERLQLENKYPRFANFKQRIIEPTAEEIRKKTSIEVQWTAIKKGRRVARIEFKFREKAQMDLL
ncbi:MAG: replication initiation protein [Candidatus Sedimenticola sp. (ex Thyasira tokunagai)]